MSSVNLPDSLTITGWDKQKSALAKEKTAATKLQAESSKVSDAYKNLDKAYSAVDFGLFDSKGIASSEDLGAAVSKIDAMMKNEIKNLLGTAKLAGAALDAFAAAAEKARKTEKGSSEKAVVAAMGAASAASKASDKFAAEVNGMIAAARQEMQALSAKLKAAEKKGGSAAPNPKAIADGKTLAALIKKSVAALRTPKGSPVPVRFLVLQQEKKLRIYLGPKPDSAQVKLKTQFDADAKLKRIKDMKAEVIWEKGALTFVSDILKGGLAKAIQTAIREQTKLSVKVRVKKSDGSVEEPEENAKIADLTDDQLKVSADEEAAAATEGQDYAERLAALKADIDAALKGPNAAKVKTLVASVNASGKAKKFADAAGDLDDLESLIAQGHGDVEDDDEVADKGAPANVPPAKAFMAKLGALMPKIRDAIAAGGEVGKAIKDLAEEAGRLAKTEKKDAVDKANALLNDVERRLAQAAQNAAAGFSVKKLATARLEWIETRDTAVNEITRLSKAIVLAFRDEADQQGKVKEAIAKLGDLTKKLKTGLETDLDAALGADGTNRPAKIAAAKTSLDKVLALIDGDELMKNLDGNEVLSDMKVVAPMRAKLTAIKAALG